MTGPHGRVCEGGEEVSFDSDWGTYEQSWDERLDEEGCPKKLQRTSCGDCGK